jgi:hypothetical protein
LAKYTIKWYLCRNTQPHIWHDLDQIPNLKRITPIYHFYTPLPSPTTNHLSPLLPPPLSLTHQQPVYYIEPLDQLRPYTRQRQTQSVQPEMKTSNPLIQWVEIRIEEDNTLLCIIK